MRKHNILTRKDIRLFSMRRNGALVQLSMAKQSLTTMVNSDLVGDTDKFALRNALVSISGVLKNWDKHYCAKLFKKLDEEANNNE